MMANQVSKVQEDVCVECSDRSTHEGWSKVHGAGSRVPLCDWCDPEMMMDNGAVEAPVRLRLSEILESNEDLADDEVQGLVNLAPGASLSLAQGQWSVCPIQRLPVRKDGQAVDELMTALDRCDTAFMVLNIGRDHGITPQAGGAMRKAWTELAVVMARYAATSRRRSRWRRMVAELENADGPEFFVTPGRKGLPAELDQLLGCGDCGLLLSEMKEQHEQMAGCGQRSDAL